MDEALVLADNLSRRDFLKLSSFSLLGMGLPVYWRRDSFGLEQPRLGRVADATVDIFSRPDFASDKRKTLWRDDVLDLVGAALGGSVPRHNRVWYEVDGLGFVHSSAIQPVENELNSPLEFVPYQGRLMELTVPFADAYWEPSKSAEKAYRFYYGSTHWILGIKQDNAANKWYQIYDDKYTWRYYARAEAFRPIPQAELTPTSSRVPPHLKRIEIDLIQQRIRCFEDGDLVFSTKISSGRLLEDGTYWTPLGDFITFRKRGSRHMTYGNRATGYDLPGVPWVCYITENGVALHGTYWHNDYGTPRSHGCINLTPEAAKWIYRWTLPVVPSDEQESWVSYGTKVEIIS
ncbi:MAG: L,D-transpeptidase [Anaerolineales bacterium]